MAAGPRQDPGIGDAGRIAYRCRHGEHPPPARAGDRNRFPLLQFDTGGLFLVRWFEGYLCRSRSTVFGGSISYFRHSRFSGPVIVLQAALTVWLLALLLRGASASAAGRCC